MNANELIENARKIVGKPLGELRAFQLLPQIQLSATMLRQQQAEIEALEKRCTTIVNENNQQEYNKNDAQPSNINAENTGTISAKTAENIANELSDELWVCLESSIISDSDTRDLVMNAATMLRQQQAEIEALKDEAAWWEMSYENCHRTCSGYGMN